MGTRNITSVIMDGKQVVCQYGQWDGYPSYSGTKILEFLRNTDIDHFKEALKNTTIQVTDYEHAVSYTGSTKDYSHLSEIVSNAKRTLSDRNGEWPELKETFKFLLEESNITEDDLENYFVWTRDTGCNILQVINTRSLDKPPLELAAMTHEYNGDYSFDIQGIYVLDLDNNTVHMTFNGCSCDFDTASLPVDIDKTMLVFEKAVYQLYEYEQKLDIPSTAAELTEGKKSTSLSNITKSIADAIISELKEEDPELFITTENASYITEAEQEFIYNLLVRTVNERYESARSMEKTALTAMIQSAENKATSTQNIEHAITNVDIDR